MKQYIVLVISLILTYQTLYARNAVPYKDARLENFSTSIKDTDICVLDGSRKIFDDGPKYYEIKSAAATTEKFMGCPNSIARFETGLDGKEKIIIHYLKEVIEGKELPCFYGDVTLYYVLNGKLLCKTH